MGRREERVMAYLLQDAGCKMQDAGYKNDGDG
jgi:hypothetical protein